MSIDVTGIDLVAFAKEVYRLSLPKGLGRFHFQPGDLSDEDANACVHDGSLDMDYVRGRCCKMHVSRQNGQLLAPDSWYDHTDTDYAALLSKFGFSLPATSAHGAACECDTCQAERSLTATK